MSISRRRPHAWLPVAGVVALGCVTLASGPLNRDDAGQESGADSRDAARQFRRLQQQDETGDVPSGGLMRAKEHVELMRLAHPARSSAVELQGEAAPSAAGTSPASWTWLGPGNIGGRVRSIVVNPVLSSTWFAGSVSGGIWKTVDSGAHWEPVNDFLASLSISTMVFQPGNPLVIYAGTGEVFTGLHGAGIFKSADGGDTWAQLTSTAADEAFTYVNRLAMSPDGAVLLAATWRGIYRSIDGGASFGLALSTVDPDFEYATTDVAFSPADNSDAIAATMDGRAWYSTNGGLTWASSSGLPVRPRGPRAELAYAPGNPEIVYASVAESEGSIYKSTDGGVTYSFVAAGANYWGTLNSEYVYDNTIWVDPTNAGTLIVGGVRLFGSTDGGVTLSAIEENVFADKHTIVSMPAYDGATNRQVLVGSDVGVHVINDIAAAPADWVSVNNNLGITQFHGAAGNAWSGTIVGGSQDTGTLRYTPADGPQAYTQIEGGGVEGDGGYVASDPTDQNYFYGERPLLSIFRHSDIGAGSTVNFGSQIPDARYNSNFIAPFILDPNNPHTLLAGGKSLWRTRDAKFGDPPSFSSIKGPVDGPYDSATLYADAVSPVSFISAIAIAPGNSDICWVGHNNGEVFRATNCTAEEPAWTQVDNNGAGLPNRMVMRLTIDPLDASGSRVYATFGGFTSDNVWRTTDGGSSWSSVSGSGAAALPAVPVHDLEIHPSAWNWLYAATEIGVFTSQDWGTTWQVPQDGPANVIVSELFWMGSDLVAATFGRGLYKTAVSNTAPSSFAKSSPANGATGQATRLSLGWWESGEATSYEYCYDTVNNNVCDTAWRVAGAATSAAVDGLTSGATYFWQARARRDMVTTEANGGTWWSVATRHDSGPPTVTVVRPNAAGEKLFTGTQFTIEWNAADDIAIETIDVFVSTNGGAVYTPVAGCVGLPGTARRCVWAAPSPMTSKGRIRVIATDAAGNSAVDASDANFKIVSGSGVITVTRPNTAVTWAIGTVQQLTWNHNLGVNAWVNVEVSRDNGATWAVVAASVQSATGSSGLFPWRVTGPATSQGRIRVSALNGPVSDISNVRFRIAPPLH